MTLEEQLAMATNTVAVNQQTGEVMETPVTTAEVQVVNQAPVNQAQMQAEAQVVQPTQTVIQQPIQMATVAELQPAMVQQPMQAAPVQMTNSDNGVQTIQLGQQVNTKHINVLKKLGVGEKVRFSLLNNEAGIVKFHYLDGMGKFACFSTDQHLGSCCRDLGEPKIRYYLPILLYPTMPNDPRVIIPGAKAELRVLSIWDGATYNAIAESVISVGHTNLDFIATGTDTFGRLDVRQQPDTFKQQFAGDIQTAMQTWEQYKATVPSLLRKNMDETTYMNTKNQAMNSQATYNNYNNYQNYNGII